MAYFMSSGTLNFNIINRQLTKLFYTYFQYVCVSRCIFLINPEDGSKAAQTVVNGKKKKQDAFNPRVATLLKKLNDFEWMQ